MGAMKKVYSRTSFYRTQRDMALCPLNRGVPYPELNKMYFTFNPLICLNI